MCDVDGKNSMAFVATVLRNGREVEIGVARYSPAAGSNTREMAVTVADEWQHRGLGTTLVKHLIETAKLNGVTHCIQWISPITLQWRRSPRIWEWRRCLTRAIRVR